MCLRELDKKKGLVKPFHNLWPRYKSMDEFMTDYEFNCYVSGEGIPQIIQYMNMHCVEAGSERIHVETCKKLANQARNAFTVVSDPVDVNIKVIEGNLVNHPYFVKKSKDPATVLNRALSLIFPDNFVQNLMKEQLIGFNTANRWLLEYRKYLVLAYFIDKMISPSEQVDQVWHLHMTYTQHYRATYQTLIERDFKHAPSSGGSSEGKKFEDIYLETLKFYKAMFLICPPDDVWETPQQRFEMRNFEYRNINLFRLAVLYSMKVANPNFLMPKVPTVPSAPPHKKLKTLPPQQKKFILRRNRRNRYKNQNKNYGWRGYYRGNTYADPNRYSKRKDSSSSSSHSENISDEDSHRADNSKHDKSKDGHRDRRDSHDHRCHRNDEYDYYGTPYFMGGGLIIIGNPCDEHYINDPDFCDHLQEGFYDDIPNDDFADLDIDDIADAAEADVDILGDANLADYGAEDMGIEDFAHDLDINEDVADLGNEGGFDYNADDFGGDADYDGFDAGDAGYDGGADGGDAGGGCAGGGDADGG